MEIQGWGAHLAKLSSAARKSIATDSTQLREAVLDLCDAVDHYFPSDGITAAPGELARVTAERNVALAVVRAVYRESKAIHAAYKLLPEALRQEVESVGGPGHCQMHGGYGFQSDCVDCREPK